MYLSCTQQSRPVPPRGWSCNFRPLEDSYTSGRAPRRRRVAVGRSENSHSVLNFYGDFQPGVQVWCKFSSLQLMGPQRAVTVCTRLEPVSWLPSPTRRDENKWLEYEREAGESDDKVVCLIEHAAARAAARPVTAPARQRQRRDEAAVAGRAWVDHARRAPRRPAVGAPAHHQRLTRRRAARPAVEEVPCRCRAHRARSAARRARRDAYQRRLADRALELRLEAEITPALAWLGVGVGLGLGLGVGVGVRGEG